MLIKLNFDNYLPDQYSKYAHNVFLTNGIPTCSFPFVIENFPEETKYFALSMIDHDSNPVVSVSWIHWLAANIEVNNGKIPEDFKKASSTVIFGQNSFASPITNMSDKAIVQNYAGPMPPDSDHNYTLKIYALSDKVDLQEGSFYNEFIRKVTSQALAMAQTDVLARV